MSDRSNRNSGNTLSFIAGIIAGGAAIYYLNTPHGKKTRASLEANASDLKHTIAEKSQSTMNSINSYTTNVAEKAVEVKNRLLANAERKAQSSLDSFEKGISKAKKRMEVNSTPDAV